MTHRIIEQLKAERIRQGLTRAQLSVRGDLDRNTLQSHEDKKFSALSKLDRWANALGLRLELVSASTSTRTERPGDEET
jgi:transcriptional regulator with XRE-family HTH domain